MSNVSQQFAEGELVNVTIRGARVVERDADDHAAALHLTYASPSTACASPLRVRLDAPGVTVERVAPAEWPPQRRDRWKSEGNGWEWFAVENNSGAIRLVNEYGDTYEPAWAMENVGPMRLLYRDGWAPATDTAPAEPEQVDERAEVVAGLRAFADLLESRPDLPGPSRWSDLIWGVSREQVDAWAQALGVTVKVSVHTDGATHYNAQGRMGVQVRPYFIDDSTKSAPAAEVELSDAQLDAAEAEGDAPVDGCECEDCDEEICARALAEAKAAAERRAHKYDTAEPLPRREPTNDGCMSLPEALADADALGLLPAAEDAAVTA